MEVGYSQFKKYSSYSNEITLFYNLNKYIQNSKHFEIINLDAYEDEFGSNVNKDKFVGYITISKSALLRDLKKNISTITGFPIDTMIGFWILAGTEFDMKGKESTIVEYIYLNEDTPISNTCYNNSILTKRYIYINIDINRNKIFSTVNDVQIKNDKKISEMEEVEKE